MVNGDWWACDHQSQRDINLFSQQWRVNVFAAWVSFYCWEVKLTLTSLNFCFAAMCFLSACLRSSPWSSPWLLRKPPSEKPSTSSRYLIRRDTHRCPPFHFSLSSDLLFAPATAPSICLLLCDLLPFVHQAFCLLIPPCRSSLFCIVIHFPLRFIFSPDTFSILSPACVPGAFCPPVFFIQASHSLPLSARFVRRSSLDHLQRSSFILVHCYSCVFHDEEQESLRVPVITKSLRPDLNTQCVWWMEAKSPH